MPKNSEQYLALQLGSFVFIDSYQHLSESLSVLATALRDKGSGSFHYTSKDIADEQKRDLLLRKGVFCYSYLDDTKKFDERRLPAREKFFNDLEQENISEQDYKHACKVWKSFRCRSLGDYHDVYLKSDLLILADVFENFRRFCLLNYELDAAHYLSGPQLAYDALFKLTGVELDLLTDIDMYEMVEKGIRGGYAGVIQRCARANNPYMSKYDPNMETSFLFYIDQNSLYSYIMQESKLPCRGFRWLTDGEIRQLNPSTIPDDADVGYILEVTLSYPEALHDIRAHKDFPLACDKLCIADEALSPLALSMKNLFNMKTSAKTVKLAPNFNEKHRYVLHYRNLKLYLQLGLVLKKIHRVIGFYQSAWMRPYIRFNIEQRQKASNQFESSLFKKFNNAIYGKTIENVKKRTTVKLVRKAEQFENLSSKPTFRSCKIIHRHLASVHMGKALIKLDRPIFLGFSILELAKLQMYRFHYGYMGQKYGANARLLFSDTDSFLYWIRTRDLYSDLASDSERFDFSNYPREHPLYSATGAKQPGLFKDESAGCILESFVGLRSKMYSLQHSDSDKDARKAKGVKKSVVRTISHQDYLDCLLNTKQMKHSFHAIRCHRHRLYTVKQTKLSLSSFDDKRYLLDCSIHSLPYGHKALKRRCDSSGSPTKYRKCGECGQDRLSDYTDCRV